MLYSQADRDTVLAIRKWRMLVVWIPTVLMLLLSIASFIWYRLQHNAGGWIVTGLITILGGAYCLFFYGVYLRPILKYKNHLDYMLDGRKRDVEGTLTEVSDTAQDKDGIDCYTVMVNIGEKNDPEDDRLFYLDAYMSMADFTVGDHIRVESNDRMIAGLYKA